MNKNITFWERILMACGFAFGSYEAYSFIIAIHGSVPSFMNIALMTLFGGIVGAGAFYLITATGWLLFKLTSHCKALLQLPSEE
jgi:hypothetical protein